MSKVWRVENAESIGPWRWVDRTKGAALVLPRHCCSLLPPKEEFPALPPTLLYRYHYGFPSWERVRYWFGLTDAICALEEAGFFLAVLEAEWALATDNQVLFDREQSALLQKLPIREGLHIRHRNHVPGALEELALMHLENPVGP